MYCFVTKISRPCDETIGCTDFLCSLARFGVMSGSAILGVNLGECSGEILYDFVAVIGYGVRLLMISTIRDAGLINGEKMNELGV